MSTGSRGATINPALQGAEQEASESLDVCSNNATIPDRQQPHIQRRIDLPDRPPAVGDSGARPICPKRDSSRRTPCAVVMCDWRMRATRRRPLLNGNRMCDFERGIQRAWEANLPFTCGVLNHIQHAIRSCMFVLGNAAGSAAASLWRPRGPSGNDALMRPAREIYRHPAPRRHSGGCPLHFPAKHHLLCRATCSIHWSQAPAPRNVSWHSGTGHCISTDPHVFEYCTVVIVPAVRSIIPGYSNP